MLGLLLVEELGHRAGVAGEVLAAGAVEVGLEVLEGEGEVEHVNVAHRVLREGGAHERRDHARAVDGPGGQRAAEQQRLARDALDLDGRRLGSGVRHQI